MSLQTETDRRHSTLPLIGSHALLMMNREAGRAGKTNVHATAEVVFSRDAPDFQLDVFTWDHTEVEQIAPRVRAAIEAGVTTIIAAGGDGTVSRIAGMMAGSDVQLGIVPLGTANLLARELGVPLAVTSALQNIASTSASRPLDGMLCGTRMFFSHVSMGTYSRLAGLATPKQKERFGRSIYLWHGLREIARRRRWNFEIEIDGQGLSRNASLIMVANIGAVGVRQFRWGRDIEPDDGGVDVCIVKAVSPGQYSQVIMSAARNRLHLNRFVEYHRAESRVSVKAHEPIPVRGDGNLTEGSMIDMKVVPAAVRVLVPTSDKID